jgi:hypothetical protein
MTDMTLEQVRDEIRSCNDPVVAAASPELPSKIARAVDMARWADAIDAALKAQGELAALRKRIRSAPFLMVHETDQIVPFATSEIGKYVALVVLEDGDHD